MIPDLQKFPVTYGNEFTLLDFPSPSIAFFVFVFTLNFNFFISPQESKGFTHKFTGDRKIYEFKTSAYVNDEVNRFAKHCLDHTELGEDLVTDFLSLTYYAGTFDHKPVAEVPVELQDTYVRLDLELAELITMLEKK